MLPRNNRLSRRDFPYYKENKKTWRGGVLQITTYRNIPQQTQDKLSVVVSKRFGVAAIRNKLKRRIYEASAEYVRRPTRSPQRFVVAPLYGLKDINKKSIENDLSSFFHA